jgi:hypothetical protein
LQTEKTKSSKSIPKEVKKGFKINWKIKKNQFSESMLSKRDFSK